MKRIIKTYGKRGVLEIIGNPQETILYLRDKPIQYSWYAEIGSTQRYHIAQGLNKQVINLNNGVEDLLESSIKEKDTFIEATEYFNSFLKYGEYEYGYYELFREMNWIEIPGGESYKSFDYYGGLVDISPTQNTINDELVNQYKEKILRGERPVIVLIHVENSWMFYILDGHHKLRAYNKANVKPHAIIITKLENKYKSIEETIDLAKKMNCTNEDYLNLMRKEKSNLAIYKKKVLNLGKTFERLTLSN